MSKKFGWIKRSLCITMAGTMVLCSDTAGYAAGLQQYTVVEADGNSDMQKAAALVNTDGAEGEIWEFGEDRSPDGDLVFKESAEAPGEAGSPEDSGNAEDMGIPEDAGSPEDTGKPEDSGSAGELEGIGGAEDTKPAENSGMTEDTTSSEDVESVEGTDINGDTELVQDAESAEELGTTEDAISNEDIESAEGIEDAEDIEAEAGMQSVDKLEDAAIEEGIDVPDGKRNEKGDLKKSQEAVGIVLTTKYIAINIGQEVSLPDYKVLGKDGATISGESVKVKWVPDDMGIVTLDTATNKVRAVKAGAAYFRLQLETNSNIYDTYRVVVKPQAPTMASVTASNYNIVEMNWDRVKDADGYIIYRKAESESDYKEIVKIAGQESTAYTDNKNLLTGTKYAYRIKAYVDYQDEAGGKQSVESDTYAVLTVTPRLGRVSIKSAVSDGYNSAVVTWEGLTGADGYTVYRADGSSKSYKAVGNTNGNTFTYRDKSLKTGTSYSYKVKGYRAVNGSKAYGEESDIYKVKPVPGETEISRLDADYKSVTLSWSKVGGASGYAVYRRGGGGSSFKKIKTVSGSSKVTYVDRSVKTGTKYTYKVRAYKKVDGESVWGAYSKERSVTPTLSATTVATANNSYNSLTLSWSRVDGADGYKVMRADSMTGSYKTIKTLKDADTFYYTDKSLSVGKTYYYKVSAYCSIGGKNIVGQKSDAVAGRAIPAATEVRAEAAGATAIKLTWSKVSLPSKNSGYYVYQVTNQGDVKVKSCSNKTTSYTVKNLTAGNQYTFKVVAYAKDKNNKVVQGKASNSLKAAPELLPVVIEGTKADSYNTIEITWKPSKAADEDSYIIYRSSSKNGGYREIGTVKRSDAAENSYKDKNVQVGKKYYYKVASAKKLPGGKTIKSKYSAAKSATAAPGTTTVTLNITASGEIRVSWKKVKASAKGYVDGYAIYRSTSEKGSYKKIETVSSGNTTAYTDNSVITGNTYYYKVRPFSKVNGKILYGPYSSAKSKRVTPGRPSIQAVSTDYQTVTVSWNRIEGSDGYSVYHAESEGGKYKFVKTVSSNVLSYKNTKLKTGELYYYKVRAFVKKDGKKIYSEYSEVKSAIPVLGKPTGLVASAIDSNQIKLTWNAVPGAETYTILRSTSEHGSYKIASEICDTNLFIDSSVSVGKAYYYKVFAVRGDAVSETTDCVTAQSSAIELSVANVVMKTGSNVKVTATVKPGGTVFWTSKDPSIAVVTSDGTIYGWKPGTTTIMATANGVTKQLYVTVKDRLDGKGIDISSANRNVDFYAIKASGYEYVMLRISAGTTQDSSFEANFNAAKAAGLKVGVYCSTKAQSVAQAEAEADRVLSILGGRKLDYPIAYSIDDISYFYGSDYAERNNRIFAFRNKVINAGKQYHFVLSVSKDWLTSYLDNSKFMGMDLWVTSYRAENLGHGYTGKGNVVMWRYTDSGAVGGVSGKANINVSYRSY